jgi:hypothetical protein
MGWAGQILSATPSNHAPVPTALANKEAFKVLIKSTPGANSLAGTNSARAGSSCRRSCAADEIGGVEASPPQKSPSFCGILTCCDLKDRRQVCGSAQAVLKVET